jgi:flagellar basal-body rod protein FlgG
MNDALYIGATAMRGQQLQIDTIAQNVANLNTVGYRRRTVSFAEIASTIANESNTGVHGGAQNSTGRVSILGAGAMPTVAISNALGELKSSGDPLSIAIDGLGFLEVIREDGSTAYTRAGQLRVNTDRMLTTADGSMLATRIQLPSDANNLHISALGVVTTEVSDGTGPVEIGRIDLAQFSNAAGLKPMGDNLYAATAESGEAQVGPAGEQNLGLIRQGFLETSNVDMSEELINLMVAQRAFEMSSKIIQAADQMLSITNGLYR